MIGCFALGSFLLLAILIRYLHSRITLASWNVRYGQATSGTPSGTNGTRSGNRPGTAQAPRPLKRTIYDKWLVLRFSVAFAALRCVTAPPPCRHPLPSLPQLAPSH